MTPGWWDEMAAVAANDDLDPYSAAWWRSMRDQHAARFPDADQRSKDNMRQFVVDAERREPGQAALDFGAA